MVQVGSGGGKEKWSASRYILKIEPSKLAGGLEVSVRKREETIMTANSLT